MPRISRSVFSNGFFHVISQGLNKSYIFKEINYKKEYLYLLKKFSNQFNIVIIAYCIMDNHVHLLLYSNSISELSAFMKSVNGSFARYYNYKENRVGYVFRGRFLSEFIKNEHQLYTCIKYIHMNPVKAKIVSNEQAYQSFLPDCRPVRHERLCQRPDPEDRPCQHQRDHERDARKTSG